MISDIFLIQFSNRRKNAFLRKKEKGKMLMKNRSRGSSRIGITPG